ncbi:hypothetical protein V6N13_020408 [Hibiscus sabdariffa]
MDKTKLSEWGEKLKTGGAQMSRMLSGKMKEILQGPTPESRIVDEATLETLEEPNWGLNMKICAMINSQEFNAAEIVRAIKKKISGKSAVTQSLSLDLLEACTTNCPNVPSEVASAKVLEEMLKMMENPYTDPGNRGRALQLIRAWGQSQDLACLPVFHQTYMSLKERSTQPPVANGKCSPLHFTLESCMRLPPPDNYPVDNTGPDGGDFTYSYGSLSAEQKKKVFKVTRNSIEVLSSMLSKETEPMPTLDELTESMLEKCKQSQPVIQMIIESTNDDGVLFEALNLNDELQQVISKFKELEADSKSGRQLKENSGTTEANATVPVEACDENMIGASPSTNEETKVRASPTIRKETMMSVSDTVDVFRDSGSICFHFPAMGKKREKSNKAKDGGKVQDQNRANTFQYEIALQVQERKDRYGKLSLDLETDEETFEEPSSVQEDGKNVSKGKKRCKYKALVEFRCRVEESILGNSLLGKPSSKLSHEESAEAIEELKEIKLWGVPLLPSKRHEGTDTVLLKFLKARDYKVHEAFEMLQRTLKWRKEFKADEIVEENMGLDFDNLAYLNSRDRDGRPLYYNMYGALKDKQNLHKILGSEEKCKKFLRWRVQYMEKAIKELNFKAGGTNSIVQIIDLKNSSGQTTKEFRSVCRKYWKLLQDHYPELIHQNIIINVPLWFYISHVFSSRLKAQRNSSRNVIARPGKVTSTLLEFIPPENLPVEYGGLQRENDDEFSSEDKVFVVRAKTNTTEYIHIPTPKAGVTMVWDLTVVGSWDISYKEEFIPDDEGSYRVLIENEKDTKKGGSVRNSFYISEPGKIVISIGNALLKKKKVLYRYKTKPTVPMYVRIKS